MNFSDTIEGSTVGILEGVKQLLDAYDFTTAFNLNGTITGPARIDSLHREVMSIVIPYMEAEHDTLPLTVDNDDVLRMTEIGYYCPRLYGDAVYMARTFIHRYHNDSLAFTSDCEEDIDFPPFGSKPGSGVIDVNASDENRVLVYPNPATSALWVELTNGGENGFKLELFTLDGRKLQEFAVNSPIYQVNTHTMPNGIYIYKIEPGDGQAYTGKFVVLK